MQEKLELYIFLTTQVLTFIVKNTRKKVNFPFFPLGLSTEKADIVFLVRQQ